MARRNIRFTGMTEAVAQTGYIHSSPKTFLKGYENIEGSEKINALKNKIIRDVQRKLDISITIASELEENSIKGGLDQNFFSRFAKIMEEGRGSLLNVKTVWELATRTKRAYNKSGGPTENDMRQTNRALDDIHEMVKSTEKRLNRPLENKVTPKDYGISLNPSGSKYKYKTGPLRYLAGKIMEIYMAAAIDSAKRKIPKGPHLITIQNALIGKQSAISDIIIKTEATSDSPEYLTGFQIKASPRGRVVKNIWLPKSDLGDTLAEIKSTTEIWYTAFNKKMFESEINQISEEIEEVFELFNTGLVLINVAKIIISRDIFGQSLLAKGDTPSAFLITSTGKVFSNKDIMLGVSKLWSKNKNISGLREKFLKKGSHLTNQLSWPSISKVPTLKKIQDPKRSFISAKPDGSQISYEELLDQILFLLKGVSTSWPKSNLDMSAEYDFQPSNFAQPYK